MLKIINDSFTGVLFRFSESFLISEWYHVKNIFHICFFLQWLSSGKTNIHFLFPTQNDDDFRPLCLIFRRRSLVLLNQDCINLQTNFEAHMTVTDCLVPVNYYPVQCSLKLYQGKCTLFIIPVASKQNLKTR